MIMRMCVLYDRPPSCLVFSRLLFDVVVVVVPIIALLT